MVATLERRHRTPQIRSAQIIPLFDDPEKTDADLQHILKHINTVRQTFGTAPSLRETLDDWLDRIHIPARTDENQLRIKNWNFNPVDNRTRFLELQTSITPHASYAERSELQRKKAAMLWGNFWTYLEEYVLFKPFASYTYALSPVDQSQMTLQGFEFTGLIDLCEKSTKTYSKRKIKPNRLKIEQVVYGQLLHEIVHQLPVGTQFFICSPPGRKKEGYLGKKNYSFIFFYTITENPTTKQKGIELHQYARWMSLHDHVELIKKFGGAFDQSLALNDKNIILHPTVLRTGFTEHDIVNHLEQFRSRTPKKHTPRQIDEVAFKEQAKSVFDHFYFPLFDELALQPLTQEIVEKMELALEFSLRKLLHWIDDDESYQTGQSKNPARPISIETDIPELIELFHTHVHAAIEKTLQFQSEEEKAIHLNRLRIQFGRNMNTIVQAGQCYSGSFLRVGTRLKVLPKAGIHSRFEIAQVVGSKEASNWKSGQICNKCGTVDTWTGPCDWCVNCDGRFAQPRSLLSSSSPPTRQRAPHAHTHASTSTSSTFSGFKLTPDSTVGLSELFSPQRPTVGIDYILQLTKAT
jgi:hypothetical protein